MKTAHRFRAYWKSLARSCDSKSVFFWLLWGDFCLYLMDAGVGNNLLQIQLKKAGASNTTIGLVKSSLDASR